MSHPRSPTLPDRPRPPKSLHLVGVGHVSVPKWKFLNSESSIWSCCLAECWAAISQHYHCLWAAPADALCSPPLQYCTAQYSTILHFAVLYSTVQYNTIQYSTVLDALISPLGDARAVAAPCPLKQLGSHCLAVAAPRSCGSHIYRQLLWQPHIDSCCGSHIYTSVVAATHSCLAVTAFYPLIHTATQPQ